MIPLHSLLIAALCALPLLVVTSPSGAAPGAHGPNGEHLDGPTQTSPAAGSVPRFEARTEAFEMVGRLQGGVLSMFVNRFETNEPVLEASVEIEAGSLKATAPFRPAVGDYVVDDAAFVAAVAKPGTHPLVIMVVAGADSDLLDATFTVGAPPVKPATTHAHAWWEDRRIALAALAVAAILAAAWTLARSRRTTSRLPGGGQ